MRYAIWVIILISGPLYATPSISIITGTTSLVQGGTITISGTNFTSYSTTTGTFDTFENGGFATYWASHNALNIGSANQRDSFSIHNATDTLTSPANDDAALQGGNTVSRSWYVSFWWYVGSNWVWGSGSFGDSPTQWLSNIKIIRFWNPGPELENVYLAFEGFQGSLALLEEQLSGANILLHIGPARLTLNTWHELRFQFVDSSALGVADGSAEIWFDTMTIYNQGGKIYKKNENFNKRPQRVGFQNEWGCNDGTGNTTPCTNSDFYMDNVYAYDSIARVEICDDPTYSNCQQFPEIQSVNSWTGTDINVTYNEGSLTGGTTQYVFVVDNAGVPSAGFALFGPPTPPPPPTPTSSGLHGHAGMNGHGVLK
jgi:hypothetical protein